MKIKLDGAAAPSFGANLGNTYLGYLLLSQIPGVFWVFTFQIRNTLNVLTPVFEVIMKQFRELGNSP